jgi:hypothetical protein
MRVGRAVWLCLPALLGVIGVIPPAGAQPNARPPGYQQIVTGPVTVPPTASATKAVAKCPKGSTIWGGGVSVGNDVQFEALGINNTIAYVQRNEWIGLADNAGTDTAQEYATAICAKKPTNYRVRAASAENPAGTMTTIRATCPAGTVMLSGGISAATEAYNISVKSAWPSSSTTFQAEMWNESTSNEVIIASVLCAPKPPNYRIVSATRPVASGVNLVDHVPCPAGSVVLGGGVDIASASTADNVMASTPGGVVQWETSSWNDTGATQNITSYAICAA